MLLNVVFSAAGCALLGIGLRREVNGMVALLKSQYTLPPLCKSGERGALVRPKRRESVAKGL
jgi:hypothetical protein